jgi:hypothetical protein
MFGFRESLEAVAKRLLVAVCVALSDFFYLLEGFLMFGPCLLAEIAFGRVDTPLHRAASTFGVIGDRIAETAWKDRFFGSSSGLE